MGTRITRKDADRALQSYCALSGQPYGHYKAGEYEDGHLATIRNGLAIDYNPTYGGCIIERIAHDGGTWVSQPYSRERKTPREMVEYISGLCAGYSDYKESPR
ncbi:hypothetical protein LCGC14_2402200 [marine sediment metagenome]|uniref:Uncharacterized protein n=1 Tax=marine sediment metagenome TaxID=412755 RepID=A0A0F9CH58_9ZZZZ